MELVTAALRVVVKFFVFIFDRLGINGILVLILLMELPAVFFYYRTTGLDYLSDREYVISSQSEDAIYSGLEMVERVDPETVVDGLSNDTIYHDRKYFLVRLRVFNEYSKEMTYLTSLDARDQDGNFLDCQRYDYYGPSSQGRVVVPGGADTLVSYVLVLSQEEVEHTTRITFTDYTDGENSFTMDFADYVKREENAANDFLKGKGKGKGK